MANQGPKVLLENLDDLATPVHQGQGVHLELWVFLVQRVMRVNLVKMEKGVVLDPLDHRAFLERVVTREPRVLRVQQDLQVNEENQEHLDKLASRVCQDLLDPPERMENLVKQDLKVKLVVLEPQVAKVKMAFPVKEVCKVLLELLVIEVLLVLQVQMVGRDLLDHLGPVVQWDHLVFKACLEKEEALEILGQKVKRENLEAEVEMDYLEKMV